MLDEPFSALDVPVQAGLCRDLRRLLREVGLSTVLVTHDPEEAPLLAEDIVVLDGGRALQEGAAVEVLARPASPRVAALLGIANVHVGTVLDSDLIASGGLELTAPTGESPAGSDVTSAVRPEDIKLGSEGTHPATVLDTVALGGAHETTVPAAELELTVRTVDRSPPATGSECQIDLPAEAIVLWPADGTPSAAPPTRA